MMLRRTEANPHSEVYQHFKRINPHMCIDIPGKDYDKIEWALKAPDGAITRDQLSALDFLSSVKGTMINYVIPGTHERSPEGVHHNVSMTVTVRDSEWGETGDYIWDHRETFSGVALMGYYGDHKHPHTPYQSLIDDADVQRWHDIVEGFTPVNYDTLREVEDNTTLQGEIACSGGSCVI
jgi:ribonucleoside-triphosphate reductase